MSLDTLIDIVPYIISPSAAVAFQNNKSRILQDGYKLSKKDITHVVQELDKYPKYALTSTMYLPKHLGFKTPHTTDNEMQVFYTQKSGKQSSSPATFVKKSPAGSNRTSPARTSGLPNPFPATGRPPSMMSGRRSFTPGSRSQTPTGRV